MSQPSSVVEYVVCHADGYPDPHRPWPQTIERANEFAREHHGLVKQRTVTPWDNVVDYRLPHSSDTGSEG